MRRLSASTAWTTTSTQGLAAGSVTGFRREPMYAKKASWHCSRMMARWTSSATTGVAPSQMAPR